MEKYERLTQRLCTGGRLVKATWDGSSSRQIVDRLAELEDKIENGTLRGLPICKNETDNDPHDEFICSHCGFMCDGFSRIEVDEDYADKNYYEFEVRYCPNCGAKVIEEIYNDKL